MKKKTLLDYKRMMPNDALSRSQIVKGRSDSLRMKDPVDFKMFQAILQNLANAL